MHRGEMLGEKDKKFLGQMMPLLDERTRRLFLASFAESKGYGSATQISEITGVSKQTITAGKKELKDLVCDPRARPKADSDQRIRAEGGGRKKFVEIHPEALDVIEGLLENVTIGNPESLLTWTTKSTRKLAAEMERQGYKVSHATVADVLKDMGYCLQQNMKYIENGDPGPDRDAQFRFIASEAESFKSRGLPVISVDAKKKEIVGNFKNPGTEYRPQKDPRLVNDHDFTHEKAVPYGIFDIFANEGFVNVGVSADTAQFAVESISCWWHMMGIQRHPDAKEVMITADGGGSNGSRLRLWKTELQKLADFTGLTFHVRHFPPGTSKWNKIEHRLFSFISMNWKGRPLETYEIIVNLIGSTTNESGLKVKCILDEWEYEKGIEVTDEEYNAINITRNEWHGEWNYTIAPHRT